MDRALFAFGLVVLLAFTVEAALGFGATVVALSVGALLLPLESLLSVLVPLNLVVSTWIVAREWRLVDGRRLFLRVLPLMGLGLPLGMLALSTLAPTVAKAVFGAFVIALSLGELVRARGGVLARPPGAVASALLLALGGVVHGAFATGGPLVVYVLGRTLDDKGRFRATLSALWLLLNAVLVVAFALRGALSTETLLSSAKLLGFLAAGLVVGEALHRRVPAELFRRLVFGLLLVAGALLVVNG